MLFCERGVGLLRSSTGILAYITSNSWLKAKYGKKLRRFLSNGHTPLRLLEMGGDVFENAIVDSSVVIARQGGQGDPLPAVDLELLPPDMSFPELPDDVWGEVRPSKEEPWSIMSLDEWRVMDKMRAVGTPLKDWDDISIYYGIKTGYNPAFIIDDATRNRLVAEDARSTEILKPILRGRDIRRYRANWAELWLIATLPSLKIDIDAYPAVKSHLRAFGKARLAQTGKRLPDGRRARKKTPHRWFELQDTCAYHAEFGKEKLFWIDLSDVGRFAYADSHEMFCVNSAYMLSGPFVKFLCAVLNSQLIGWFMRKTALNSGMGVVRWIRSTVDVLPIPRPKQNDNQSLVRLVDRILQERVTGRVLHTAEIERQINAMVYMLYGLTKEEIEVVAAS